MSTTRRSRMPWCSSSRAVASSSRRRVCAPRLPTGRPSWATTGSPFTGSARGPEVDEAEVVVGGAECRFDAHADAGVLGRAVGHRREDARARLLELDERDDERHPFVERRYAVLPDDGEAVDGPAT